MEDNSKIDLESIKQELEDIKQTEEKAWESDVIKKTVSSLLSIEKQALYGSVTGKGKKIDDIISKAIKRSKG